jgi:hypothetical protein
MLPLEGVSHRLLFSLLRRLAMGNRPPLTFDTGQFPHLSAKILHGQNEQWRRAVVRENRATQSREKENSKLLVRGLDTHGESFNEETTTHDISETGVSFFLRTPIWVDTLLSLMITGSQILGSSHETRGKVVRVKLQPDGRQFVAVRFDE